VNNLSLRERSGLTAAQESGIYTPMYEVVCCVLHYGSITMSLSTPSENATRFKLWNNYITSPESAALSNISALFGGVVIAAFVLTTLRGVRAQCSEGVPFKRGIPFIGSWSFFTHRYEFIEDGLRRLGSKFRFSILNVRRTWLKWFVYR
jgi:hypothetical protein